MLGVYLSSKYDVTVIGEQYCEISSPTTEKRRQVVVDFKINDHLVLEKISKTICKVNNILTIYMYFKQNQSPIVTEMNIYHTPLTLIPYIEKALSITLKIIKEEKALEDVKTILSLIEHPCLFLDLEQLP